MKIGAVIIGDEILSGKRKDSHFEHCQSVLAARGLELSWTVIVGDDPAQLARFLRFTMSGEDLVFSFGGIGATPDDRTRQTVALINDVPLYPHPQAVAEIEAQFGETAYPNRILMAEIPKGSEIIPNPVNRVPGFSFKHHHFMPGFPQMAWPMMEWVLDTYYPDLQNLRPQTERIIYVTQGRESDLLHAMQDIVMQYPQVLLSSLPHLGEQPHIEFSLRGEADAVEKAMQQMIQAIEAAGFVWCDQLTGNQ